MGQLCPLTTYNYNKIKAKKLALIFLVNTVMLEFYLQKE